MKHLEITTKIGCSNMCKYCPQKLLINKYKQTKGNINLEVNDFKLMLKNIPKNVILVFGGFSEPYLNTNCSELIKEAKINNSIYVMTTLMGMKMKDVDLLKRINPEVICIHLPSNNNIDHIKVDDLYFSILRELIQSDLCISFVSFGKVKEEVFNFLKDFGINYESQSKRRLLSRAGLLYHNKGSSIEDNMTCSTNFDNQVLLPNGDVYLCCMDYGLKHKLGNLKEINYKCLFKREEFLAIKQGIGKAKTICQNCEWMVNKEAKPLFKDVLFSINFRLKKILMKYDFGRKILKSKGNRNQIKLIGENV